MSSATILTIVQVALSLLLVAAVLLQNRGAGLGHMFGGDSAIYRTKRGLEKRLHQATIVLAAAFLLLAALRLVF